MCKLISLYKSISCLFIFCSLNTHAQKQSDYKYIYKFQLPETNDTAKIVIDTTENQEHLVTLKGKITNNKSEPLSFLTISIKSKDSTFYLTTNNEGFFETSIKPSLYELIIDGVGYKSFKISVNANGESNFNFKLILSKSKPLEWFDIYSKKELCQQEIEEIKKCVQSNNQNVSKCRKKNLYYVLIEI